MTYFVSDGAYKLYSIISCAGLLISKYRVSPIKYRRLFLNINRVIADTFEKSIDKVSPIRFMARNVDMKLPILCDGQGQTTLGGLILRTVWRTTNVSSAAATDAGRAAGQSSLNSAHCPW